MSGSINAKSYLKKYVVNVSYDSSQNSCQNVLPSILKNKYPKSLYCPAKRKTKKSNTLENEFNTSGSQHLNTSYSVSNPCRYFKIKRHYKSDDSSDDVNEDGDIQTLNILSPLKKKYKRVRFSDSNDIISSGYFETFDENKLHSLSDKNFLQKENITTYMDNSFDGDVSTINNNDDKNVNQFISKIQIFKNGYLRIKIIKYFIY